MAFYEFDMTEKLDLIMLGIGNAMAVKCYNTCFAIRRGEELFLVDAGGGNGILRQFAGAGLDFAKVRNMFVTHGHTDHLLGVFWVIRKIATMMQKGEYDGVLKIYCHDDLPDIITGLCRYSLPGKINRLVGDRILLCPVADGESVEVSGMKLTAFDIHSTKLRQFGFSLVLPDGRRLACLGDEPFNPLCMPYVKDSDWLLCEAFCLYRDREKFKPYEKHHSTAKDAGRLASELGIRNLVLYHTEDKTLDTRKHEYAAEASETFSGNVFVPDDLETIVL